MDIWDIDDLVSFIECWGAVENKGSQSGPTYTEDDLDKM